MISKYFRSNRGNALIIALILAIMILLAGVGIITRNVQQSRVAKKNFNESRALVTAHSFAALLKQDLLTNYQAYLDTSNAAWAPCRNATVNADSFMHILSEPSNGAYVSNTTTCPQVIFTSEYFVPVSAASFQLGTLKTTAMKPKPEFQVNGFSFETTLSDFNLNAMRNSVSSSFLMATTAKSDVPVSKNLRLVIDIRRTLATASGATCGICRTVPGAVCCGNTVSISYLESGSGRIMDVLYDEGAGTLVSQTENTSAQPNANPNPAAISIKNISTTRTDYTDVSFCIAPIQGSTALRYIIDGAVDGGGASKYLTTHGDILDGSTGAVVASDPKLVSIAFDTQWYLLRSDGQVLKTTNLADTATYTPMAGFVIPTAAALAMGRGPTDACTP